MDDTSRISTIKAFLLKQNYVRPFRFAIAIVEDVPVIMFDTISDIARARLNEALYKADLLHIQIITKSALKPGSLPVNPSEQSYPARKKKRKK